MDDFDRIAQEAWGNTPLEEMYSLMDVAESDPEPITAKLIGFDGKPICCSICGQSDQWQPEQVKNETVMIWVCEHDPEPEVAGLMPCRVLDSVTTDKIMIVDGNG